MLGIYKGNKSGKVGKVNVLDVIAKKVKKEMLDEAEIEYLVKGFVENRIHDVQMAAFLMAIYINGLSVEETYALTKAIAYSGSTINLDSLTGPTVDKHSTGGVGDKITLILAPLMAAAGAKFAKLSGRALGHTGGTIDKLESIPGFNVRLDLNTFVRQIERVGVVIASQTADLCPADKKIYVLRDKTGTIDSIELIASSVMGKKLAGGAESIILDVKVGNGAFMRTLKGARNLASLMVKIGKRGGRRVEAVISNMDQPLGYAVGNALEVAEAVDVLRGRGPTDVMELSLVLGARLVTMAGITKSNKTATRFLADLISNGKALEKFEELIEAQGGEGRVAENPRKYLPHARYVDDLLAERNGYIHEIQARKIGEAATILRQGKEGSLDPSAGLVLLHKVGDYINAGDPLVEIHADDLEAIVAAKPIIEEAVIIKEEAIEGKPLVYEVIR
jgi:pyrimidine-nucleoside phosphorylase